MRSLCTVCFLLAVATCLGCGKPKPKNIAADLEQSDIDKYNEMLQAEQATMAEGEAAAKAAGVKDY